MTTTTNVAVSMQKMRCDKLMRLFIVWSSKMRVAERLSTELRRCSQCRWPAADEASAAAAAAATLTGNKNRQCHQGIDALRTHLSMWSTVANQVF